MTKWDWCSGAAILFVAVAALVVAAVLGAVCLRVGGIAFAMVTLAFAQAGKCSCKNPHGLTGGEEGLGLDYTKLPATFVGIFNTKHLYWLALGYVVVVFVVVRWAVDSSPGRVWQAIRENELRVAVLGLHPYPFKLIAFVLSSFLAARGRHRLPAADQRRVAGRDHRELHADAARDGRDRRRRHDLGRADRRCALHAARPAARRARRPAARQDLPKVLRIPLSEPLFLLGVLFILVVFLLPGGLARRRQRFAGLRQLDAEERSRSRPGRRVKIAPGARAPAPRCCS